MDAYVSFGWAHRRLVVAPLSACLAVLWASDSVRAEARPPYGGQLVSSLPGEPSSFDPVLAHSDAEVAIARLVFDTLYRPGAGGDIVPHLAAGLPEPGEDGGSVRVPLRDDVRFHDGRAMGAEDVVRSLTRARASNAGWLLAPVTDVFPDDDGVVFQLESPNIAIERLLTAPATSITPEGRPPAAESPVGSGPFELASVSRPRERVSLRAFESHFAGRPYIDEISFRWYTRPEEEARRYEIGESHVSRRGAVAFAQNRPLYATREREGDATTLTYLGFGRGEPALADSPLVRRALALAVSRRALRGIGAGEEVVPARSPLPPALGGPKLEPNGSRAQIREASRLLERAKAGSPSLRARLGGGASLPVLVDESRPEDREVAERVVAALYRLGLGAHVEDAPARGHARRTRRGDCVLYVGQLAPLASSWDVQLAAGLAAGGERAEAADLIRGERDMARALTRFEATLPIIPLFHRGSRMHHRTDVYGLSFDRLGLPAYADAFFFGDPERARAAGR